MRLQLPIVVDASVAMKWLVREEHTDKAWDLYAGAQLAKRPFVAPPHFAGEVLNALYRRTQRGDGPQRLNPLAAERAVRLFLRMDVQPREAADLYPAAFALARDHQLPTIYDALYVALAEKLGCELWTADLALLRSVGPSFPFVRWIADYPNDPA
ncbi:MAG: PIN domain-containing protein [Chloroflexota bacterium]|nr:MAG: PIN domain-containing protein [Chloroflexota bacterium]